MRTILLILGGFLLLWLGLLAARRLGGSNAATVVTIFLFAWLAVAGGNMWYGVSHAGYSVAEEFPIFLLIFGLPAAAAIFIWWKHS